MNANPMTGQVGKLVGNLLAGGGAVFLPGVGSLYVERRGARRIDRRHVVPPCRTVLFTSQQRGPSLIDEIGRVLRVNGVQPENPAPEAQQVYDRWMAAVQVDGTLTIEGVGALRFKDFKLDKAFDQRLNPQGHAPVRVRAPKRFDAVLWIGIVAIVCVLGGTAYWWFEGRTGERTGGLTSASGAVAGALADAAAETTERSGVESSAGTDLLAENSGADASVGGAETTGDAASNGSGTASGHLEAARAAETTGTTGADRTTGAEGTDRTAGTTGTDRTTGTEGTPGTAGSAGSVGTSESGRAAVQTQSSAGAGFGPSKMISGHHYVVMGVFSTVENAERAARDAASKDVAIACGIYRFGAKFMVSPFESDDREACRLFAAAHEERFPNMWTYTAR